MMIVKKEFRQERDDVFSFWGNKKVLNDQDEIEFVKEKIDECTIIMLQGRISELDKQIALLTDKKQVEQTKIQMINEIINNDIISVTDPE
jgi:hypothetical protein